MSGGDITTKQYRDWFVTVPADGEHGISAEQLIAGLQAHKTWAWVFQTEVGENGYLHHQLYVQSAHPIKYKTLQKALSAREGHGRHVEAMKGTVEQCINYCSSTTFVTTKGIIKTKTVQAGPFRSEHEFNMNHRGQQSSSSKGTKDSDDIPVTTMVHDLIMSGTPPWEVSHMPWAISSWPRLRNVAGDWWNDYKLDVYGDKDRDVKAYYLQGDSRLGKTRATLDYFGRRNVHAVTGYKDFVDGYRDQPVLVLDEFKGAEQLDITVMNSILEGYPRMVSSRYHDVFPMWTTVVVISNLKLEDLYPHEPEEIRQAFQLRFPPEHRLHQTMKWNDPEFVSPWEALNAEEPKAETAQPELPLDAVDTPEEQPSELPPVSQTVERVQLDSIVEQMLHETDRKVVGRFISSPAFNTISRSDRNHIADHMDQLQGNN